MVCRNLLRGFRHLEVGIRAMLRPWGCFSVFTITRTKRSNLSVAFVSLTSNTGLKLKPLGRPIEVPALFNCEHLADT